MKEAKLKKTYIKFVSSIFFLAVIIVTFTMNAFSSQNDFEGNKNKKDKVMINNDKLVKATFGAGCFWCVEAVFERLEGVYSVKSGYAGGHVDNPSYKQVTTGNTGHAEVAQIEYDPNVIGFKELLEVFWQTHDPTTLNRQGADVGTQYRSAIFYHNNEQKELAENYKNELDKAEIFDDPIVTEITKLDKFYIAEDYHQDYYDNNKYQPYCSFVITPKIEKFEKVFKDKLKEK